MEPFTRVEGVVCPLDRADVDTDQIIPKQFLKRIERTGYGQYLFFDWMKDPDFELRRPEYEGARILLAGRNFGCGSSREHAPWGLQDFGFDVVIAPSFGDIFRQNCLKIGLLPVELPAEQVKQLIARAEEGAELTVDLETQTVAAGPAGGFTFVIDPFQRHCLLEGLDEIALTLAHAEAIAAYESARTPPVSTTSLAV
ncbi:MAG TPA: 3-isopropylmalate dehydratase small subunit [Gaiellaceae bacterium]|nr:3-isopropylmalate dehydratase small subunit [Gaiellaceae bacterium]